MQRVLRLPEPKRQIPVASIFTVNNREFQWVSSGEESNAATSSLR